MATTAAPAATSDAICPIAASRSASTTTWPALLRTLNGPHNLESVVAGLALADNAAAKVGHDLSGSLLGGALIRLDGAGAPVVLLDDSVGARHRVAEDVTVRVVTFDIRHAGTVDQAAAGFRKALAPRAPDRRHSPASSPPTAPSATVRADRGTTNLPNSFRTA